MKELKYRTSNHTVKLFGRLWFTVTSASRKGVIHFVDLEPNIVIDKEGKEHVIQTCCSCEAWYYAITRPCRHIEVCVEAIAHWAKISEDRRQEWCERMLFLLAMGHSFQEALMSDSLITLRRPEKTQRKRQYELKAA